MTQEHHPAFALGTFSIAGCTPFAAVVRDDKALALEAVQRWRHRMDVRLTATATLLDFVEDWEANLAGLARFLESEPEESRNDWVPVQVLRTHAPLSPRQVLCTGANYRQHVMDHAADFGGGANDAGTTAEERREEARRKIEHRAAHGTPYAFAKLPSAIIGPFDPIRLPSDITQPDWELELAVVIARPARHVRREDAMRYVAGYTVANDVTARDRLYRPDMRTIASDWLSSKSPPTFLPMGPYLVPSRFVPDPGQLRITLELNGQTMQDALTSDMIFDIARQIEYLSNRVTLLPGDVILTGSPAGNGTHHKRFLREGDEIVGRISGLGSHRNRCELEGACS
jgi:2,4-diketo-3-deoxy-L-fuconate hydrolase